jgi:hypothetical protein
MLSSLVFALAVKLTNLTPSERFFNAAALVSLLASVTLWFLGARQAALFVGLWVPSIIGWMNFFAFKDQLLRNQRAIIEQERQILEEMHTGASSGASSAGSSAADAPEPEEAGSPPGAPRDQNKDRRSVERDDDPKAAT